ncbi:zinc-binding alcohol dehydrogenase [uncultured Eubacterium sp.]|uniref:zinc-dependent alcohol dehydrogenase n=1 Tax=uncultured Eubacterium sp. TaxID=165185 RepID=UPI00259756DE|nr:zinc-binding alcohol dehydrogenase [uncultured Eubacterium sp.]
MKTIYAEAQPGKVVLKEKEIPAPGKGEVLLKAKYSAMSPGTENGLLGEHIVPLPTSIGYAMAAEVIEVGEDVEDLKVGDHVVATVEHAQYVVTSELNCTLCPEGVDLKQAAFWNLGHTGMYALRRSGLQLGEPCAVLGQGFVGAITAQCARIAGAVPVIVTDLDDNRLEAAKKMGADVVINSKTDPEGLEREVAKLNRGGLPVIFEATGARGPLMQAAELVSERGRVVMISQVHGEAMPPIDDPIMQKGASLIGTYVNSKPYKLRRADLLIEGAWPPVMGKKLNRYVNSDCWTSDEDIQVFLNLIKYGKLDITPLISHEFSYKQIPEAYADYVFPHVNPDMTGGLICWEE